MGMGQAKAKQVSVDASTFNKNLDATVVDAQRLAEAVDELDAGVFLWESSFLADQLLTPNSADWGVNAPAAVLADPSNAAINVAAFDDTAEEGVGMEVHVPTSAAKLRVTLEHRAASAPSGDQTVDFRLRFRSVPDNAAVPGSWTTVDMANVTIPNGNVYYRYTTYEFDLATIGMVAGTSYLIEWTRYTGGADTLTGDLYVRLFRLTVVGTPIVDRTRWFGADSMRSAGTDWSIAADAPVAADSNNEALLVRRHDDTAEEGSGLALFVPAGSTKLTLHLRSRAETAPGSAQGVGVTLHYRKLGDNAAVGSWVQYDLPVDVSVPANEYWQYDSWEITLATLGTPITPGSTYQFQVTRNTADAGDTLTGDWTVWQYGFSFD